MCKAFKGTCPYGGSVFHFNNEQDAQIFADNTNKFNYGLLKGIKLSELGKQDEHNITYPNFGVPITNMETDDED